jgi:hypothetical protein
MLLHLPELHILCRWLCRRRKRRGQIDGRIFWIGKPRTESHLERISRSHLPMRMMDPLARMLMMMQGQTRKH